MLTYFDESYAIKQNGNTLLTVGALFIPSERSKKFLHAGIKSIKDKFQYRENGEYKEIKYSDLKTSKSLKVARDCIDLFCLDSDSYHRVYAVEFSTGDLDKVGRIDQPKKIRFAIVYTRLVRELFRNHAKNIKNGVLLMDNLTRVKEDKFEQIIGGEFKENFRHIGMVDSKRERNHTVQLADLLTGLVTNSNNPSLSPSRGYKNKASKYLTEKIETKSLRKDYWEKMTLKKAGLRHKKYLVRFCKIQKDRC